jgi:ABC-2 type transport system ATP-binding protein
MHRLKQQGTTIFLNSHLLGEVELICDRVAILQRGEIIRIGDIATLTRMKNLFIVGLAPGQTFPRDEVTAQGYHVAPLGDLWEVTLTDGQTIDPVVDLLRARGLGLRHLIEKRQSLEDLFLATVEAAEPGVDAPAVLPVAQITRK